MRREKRNHRNGTRLSDILWLAKLGKTTQLKGIRNRKVLVLIDEQNLSIAVNKRNLMLQYDLLAERIKSAASLAKLHIFIATYKNDESRKKQLARMGYVVHVKKARKKYSSNGRRDWDSNVDNLYAFWVGLYARKNKYDVMILASGDYGLAGELSRAICTIRQHNSPAIMSLSLPGSTSEGLKAHWNRYIKANLYIGLDLLGPLHRRPHRSNGGNGNGRRHGTNPFC